MIARTDLDRALRAWFSSESASPPPAEPLARVIATTRTIRPRPAVAAGFGSAWIGSDAASGLRYRVTELRRPALVVLVALLALALVGGAVLVAGQLLRPRPAPRTYVDQFVAATDLSHRMAHPTVVPLIDGRVLVMGNEGDGGSQVNVGVVYDPATGASADTGPMQSADTLDISAAVRLVDGRVLVVGAEDSQVFDPTTMQFASAGSMVAASRWGAAAALLPDGRVLISGGASLDGGPSLNTAELFDPRTLAFSATGSMAGQRSGHSMVALSDGRVFVTPGASQLAELYDSETETFTPAGATETFIDGPAVVLADGRVVVFTAQGLHARTLAWAWGPDDFSFTYLQGLPFVTSAQRLDDGRILLTGLEPLTWAGSFEPTTHTFRYLSPPSAFGPVLTRLDDGGVLVVGGLEDGQIRTTNGGNSAPGVPTVEIFE